jgi:hypothetical protein
MKEFTITAPDGRQIKVNAPEDATDEQLIRAAQQQIQLERPKATPSQALLASVPGRMVKGVKDQFDGLAQMLPRGLSTIASAGGLLPNAASQWLDSEAKRLDDDIKGSENEYQAARWAAGQSGMDVARGVGNVVSPTNLALAQLLPVKAAGWAGRALQGAKAGAAGGVMNPVTDATEETPFAMQKVGQATAGAAGGAVAAPLVGKLVDVSAPALKAAAARIVPGAQQKLANEASSEAAAALAQVSKDLGFEGNMPPALAEQLRKEVTSAMRQGKTLDASALARSLDFKAQNLPALRGQITRDPREFSQAMNLRGLQGIGDPIQDTLTAQNQGLTRDLGRYARGAQERFPAGEGFLGSLKAYDEKANDAIRRAYANARAGTDKEWDVPLQGLAQDFQSVIDDFGDIVPGAIVKRAQQLGILDGGGMTQRRIFNYEEADKLLKQINRHYGNDVATNRALDSLNQSVKRAITESSGPGDPYAVARKMAAERFKLHERAPALAAAVRDSIAADDFVQKFIINGKVSEVRELAKILPEEQIKEARRQIGEDLMRGAFRGNAAGDKGIQTAGLQERMRALGTDKLKAFFSQQELDELQRITRISAYVGQEPAFSTVAKGGNPGGVLLGSLSRLGGMPSALGQALPLLGPLKQSVDVRRAMNTAIPKTANLTAEEIAAVSGLLGGTSVVSGGLLAPRP